MCCDANSDYDTMGVCLAGVKEWWLAPPNASPLLLGPWKDRTAPRSNYSTYNPRQQHQEQQRRQRQQQGQKGQELPVPAPPVPFVKVELFAGDAIFVPSGQS